ncbi:MAG: hypothetical protein BGP06_15670 [Rhizobiales bacterium 65-9]|nr:glycosyltransferase family 4 protein [Hyphomicrobiales bacterium]OJY38187.1 MAG: hypothetical protein BGP06_15670 [Rhizobiales bacterium 65-9]
MTALAPRCLFLSPMKPLDDAVPSGDRATARLLAALLGRIAYRVEPCSRMSARLRDGSDAEIDALVAAASQETARILAREAAGRERPAFVFTYHNYYKAPDLIGPALSRALGVPYLIAEASRASKRAAGRFARAHALAEESIDAADIVFALTDNDRIELARLKPAHQTVVDLKPFLDPGAWPQASADRTSRGDGACRLLAVAMMRSGDKMRSYAQLAAALRELDGESWTIDIVGDGPERDEVERLFAPFRARARLLGRVDDPLRMSAIYRSADLFVWPGVNEAFGMAYLEAQAHGVACVASAQGGVSDAIRDGETGLIVGRDDPQAFADAVARLLHNEASRQSMGEAAQRFVREERSIERAGVIVRDAIAALRDGARGAA